jgi:hypothetical protein
MGIATDIATDIAMGMVVLVPTRLLVLTKVLVPTRLLVLTKVLVPTRLLVLTKVLVLRKVLAAIRDRAVRTIQSAFLTGASRAERLTRTATVRDHVSHCQELILHSEIVDVGPPTQSISGTLSPTSLNKTLRGPETLISR